MKKLLCGVATIISLYSYAQEDSVRLAANDTLPLSDTLTNNVAHNKPLSGQPVYKLKPAVDIPLFVANAAWCSYTFSKIYSKDAPGEEKILSLDINDINWFDRWAVRPHSQKVSDQSDYIFYGSMVLPAFFLITKETRKDVFKLAFLYLEAMSVTGVLYTSSVYFTNRFRPYAYSDETPMEWRNRGGAQNSFYAGHVALVATSTFFMAKVYSDYNPGAKANWVLYSVAGLATGTMAYLRYRGGFHFPTDLLLGVAQGTLTGILVPHFHKNPLLKNSNVKLTPYISRESKGFALVYKF